MSATPCWAARTWLPYSLAGVIWVTVGSFALGIPRGLGLVFIGLSCLSIGLSGALWRVRHGYALLHELPPNRN